MSIPPNHPGRGCGSQFPLPVSSKDLQEAQYTAELVYFVNCRDVGVNDRLADIIYRPGELDIDVTRRLFRWDTRSYEDIFRNGFVPWPQGTNTSDAIYFNLNQFVQRSGAPLASQRNSRHAFVSTTFNTNWRPNPSLSTLPSGRTMHVYRYEIYAPGGIWVSTTLGPSRYQFASQDEVCFVAGIAPQFILSAQRFTVSRPQGSGFPRSTRSNNTIIINRFFNPMPDPDAMVLIQAPTFYYVDENNVRRILTHIPYPPEEQERRSLEKDEEKINEEEEEKQRIILSTNSSTVFDWYSNGVAREKIYTINAAFRASARNEVYMFIGRNEYVLLNYAPGSTNDYIIGGPKFICDGYHSLVGQPFGEMGIDCAFDTVNTEAFIFNGNLCARINYSPGNTNDKILDGGQPKTIVAYFKFLSGTVFEKGIDAAFNCNVRSNEAYLFRFNEYVRINYNTFTLIDSGRIRDAFPCLIGTVFESGMDAAFVSHRSNEAYVFKDDVYALMRYVPGGKVDDYYLIGGKPKLILPNWPSLRQALPRMNAGVDIHSHPE